MICVHINVQKHWIRAPTWSLQMESVPPHPSQSCHDLSDPHQDVREAVSLASAQVCHGERLSELGLTTSSPE